MSRSGRWTSRLDPSQRCCHIVPARYAEPGHQCWWKVIRDGYCRRHHPVVRIQALLNQRAAFADRLQAVNDQIAEQERLLEAARK